MSFHNEVMSVLWSSRVCIDLFISNPCKGVNNAVAEGNAQIFRVEKS